MDVLGYANRLSARAGERIEFMVHCERAGYRANLVRLERAFTPADPGAWRPDVVESSVSGDYPGRQQPVHAGSYVEVPGADLSAGNGVTISAKIYPTLPARGREQGIVGQWSAASRSGFVLGLNSEGQLFLRTGTTGDESLLVAERPLTAKRWYAVAAVVNAATGTAGVYWQELPRGWVGGEVADGAEGAAHLAAADGPLLIGATHFEGEGRGSHAAGCFNGKIDRPLVWKRALSDDEFIAFGSGTPASSIPDLLADWDVTVEHRGRRLIDTSPAGVHGRIVNLPARLVPGSNWTGGQIAFHTVPEQFQALHFHEDDLEDCEWEVDFGLDVPADLPSGIYAARLEAGETVDHVPFYVRPAAGAETAGILYLAPTATYLAYGNEKLFMMAEHDPEMVAKMSTSEVRPTAMDEYLRSRPELAASCYDLHLDGSGFIYSSRLRPLLSMRPDATNWLTGQLRHFSGDLYLVEWLNTLGFRVDVATDEDLHLEGVDALSPYKVVITGGHPEYWSEPMLDALEGYLRNGGRLMYLGGNGFYWATGIDRDYPHVVEVRKGQAGTRSWTSEPGETHLSTTGQPGGLWRLRGRSPNKLTGIGFAAQGWGGAAGYVRLPESRDPRADWIFEGLGDDEVIGEFGYALGGAAGDEIDRFDLDLGTPPETLRLATSEGRQSNYYQLVIEDLVYTLSGMGGQEEPRVRSDITLLETPNGGAVFAAGSISFNTSLTWNGCDNNVSRMTANVLRRFSGQ